MTSRAERATPSAMPTRQTKSITQSSPLRNVLLSAGLRRTRCAFPDFACHHLVVLPVASRAASGQGSHETESEPSSEGWASYLSDLKRWLSFLGVAVIAAHKAWSLAEAGGVAAGWVDGGGKSNRGERVVRRGVSHRDDWVAAV